MIHCPRDREILASNDLNSYRYYSCQRCSGYWIPGKAMDKALSEHGIASLRRFSSLRESQITCPDCSCACASISIEECELDVCHHCHGVWFDNGEALRMKNLFPKDSAIVNTDGAVKPPEQGPGGVALFIVDIILTIITCA